MTFKLSEDGKRIVRDIDRDIKMWRAWTNGNILKDIAIQHDVSQSRVKKIIDRVNADIVKSILEPSKSSPDWIDIIIGEVITECEVDQEDASILVSIYSCNRIRKIYHTWEYPCSDGKWRKQDLWDKHSRWTYEKRKWPPLNAS